MPGQQLYSYSEGNRAEKLADLLLSKIAAVIPVPREVDYGIDFLCTLTRRENNILFAGRAFALQVKSDSHREVHYGGINDRGEWKNYELDWLYNQDQPIILCSANLDDSRIRLYTTARMWWVVWEKGRPGEVILVPDEELDPNRDLNNLYPSERIEFYDKQRVGDGYSYRVPLGKPIVDITIDELDGKEMQDTLRACIDHWLDLDYRNIRHYQMSVPYYEEWQSWEPNTPATDPIKVWYFSNPRFDQNIREIVSSISPGVVSLVNNLIAQKQTNKLELIRPLYLLVNEYSAQADIMRKFSEEYGKTAQ